MLRNMIRCGIVIVVLATVGCGGGADQNPGQSGEPDAGADTGMSCTRDPELIAQQPACQFDDECPCGTHCELGRCTAQCATANDCAVGEVCDDFGRCRASGDAAMLPLPDPQGQGSLAVDRTRLFISEEGPNTLAVSVSRHPVTRARVAAARGVEVRCSEDADFAENCGLTDLQPGDTASVEVQYAADYDPSSQDIPSVTVYGPSNHETVMVPRFDQLPDAELAAKPLVGHYAGTLRLNEVGTDLAVDEMSPAPIPVQFDVNADVWEVDGGVVVAIDDPYDALTSEEQFIGRLELGEQATDGVVDGTASFEDHPFARATIAGRENVLLSSTVDATVRSRQAPRTLSMALTQVYRGMGISPAPAVKWSVELQREGGTTAAIPDRSHLPATTGYDPAARGVATPPWAAAFRGHETYGPDNIIPGDSTRDRLADADYTRACGLGRDKRVEIQRILSGYMMALEGEGDGQYMDYPFADGIRAAYHAALDKTVAEYRTVDPNVTGVTLNALIDPASWADMAPEGLDEGIACGFQDFAVTVSDYHVPADLPDVSETTASIDFCNQLAQEYKCQVKSVDVDHSLSLTGAVDFLGANSYRQATFDVTTKITKVCGLPAARQACGEKISCIDADSTDRSDYRGWGFGTSLTAQSKDQRCANSPLAAGIALDRQQNDLSATEVLETCISELDALDEAPPAYGSPKSIFDDSAKCVDAGRLLAALGAQAMVFGDHPPETPANLPPEGMARAGAYTQRLLVRWLQLYGFMATETDQGAQMSAYFRRGLNQTDPERLPPTLDTMLPTEMRGLDLLATPTVASAVLRMPVDALAQPDYRQYGANPVGSPGDDPNQALAPVLLETLVSQGDLLERYVTHKGTSQPADVDYLARWMPRMLLAQTMAADIKRRVDAAGVDPSWSQSYDTQARRARASVMHTVDFITGVNAGANPLGVEDYDLPLYHTADANDGNTDRFSAITDYIAGRRDDQSGWATKAIERAQSSLEAAEDVYVDAAEREWRNGLVDTIEGTTDQLKKDVRRKYNTKIFDICGPNLGADDADYDPLDDPSFDAATCAVADTDACRLDVARYYNLWTTPDVLGRMCVADQLRSSSAIETGGFADSTIDDFAKTWYDPAALPTCFFDDCHSGDGAFCLYCRPRGLDESHTVPVDKASMTLQVPLASSTGDGKARASAALHKARQVCAQRHPFARFEVAPDESPLEKPDCLTGSLGEAYLDVVAAAADVQAARIAYGEHMDAYDIAVKSCFIQQQGNRRLRDERRAHRWTMRRLRHRKLVIDGMARAAGALKDCGSTMSGVDSISGVVAGAATCAAAAMEAAYEIKSLQAQENMDNIEQSHDDLVARISENTALRRCYVEAKQELIGVKTANADISSAAFALQRAQANIDGQIQEAQRLYNRGRAQVEELSEDSAPVDGDTWAQPKIETYVKDFRLAKRATYLALRAVEYEYQQSLAARQDVLEAQLPEDLQGVLDELWTTAATRRINGNAANELTAVVSLRDDILQLGDKSKWPEFMHSLDAKQRFRALLTSERYAVYDDAGQYLGQRIPFKLAPLGALNVDTNGAAIYSRNDCAERLWSVDAGIVGEDAPVGGSRQVRLDIAQRNSFYSQWCTPPAASQAPFQYASVRPSRNLFRVPGDGVLAGTDRANDSVEQFSIARVQADVGTDEPTLEAEQDSAGASAELATRGLYGDYSVFIDTQNISRNGSDGVDLNAVDDILLRFDYLSVAK